MHGWDKGWFSVPYSFDCVAAAPPCIDHYNRNTGVYQVLDPPKHPEGLCPRGAALWVQLCQIMWAKEPAPAKTKEPSPCLPSGADPRCHRSAEHRSATCLPPFWGGRKGYAVAQPRKNTPRACALGVPR